MILIIANIISVKPLIHERLNEHFFAIFFPMYSPRQEKIKQIKKENSKTIKEKFFPRPMPIPTPKLSIDNIKPIMIASLIDKILSLLISAFVASKAMFKNSLKLNIFIVSMSFSDAFLFNQIFIISLKNFTIPTIINSEKETYFEKVSFKTLEKRYPNRIPLARTNVFRIIIKRIILNETFILAVPYPRKAMKESKDSAIEKIKDSKTKFVIKFLP